MDEIREAYLWGGGEGGAIDEIVVHGVRNTSGSTSFSFSWGYDGGLSSGLPDWGEALDYCDVMAAIDAGGEAAQVLGGGIFVIGLIDGPIPDGELIGGIIAAVGTIERGFARFFGFLGGC